MFVNSAAVSLCSKSDDVQTQQGGTAQLTTVDKEVRMCDKICAHTTASQLTPKWRKLHRGSTVTAFLITTVLAPPYLLHSRLYVNTLSRKSAGRQCQTTYNKTWFPSCSFSEVFSRTRWMSAVGCVFRFMNKHTVTSYWRCDRSIEIIGEIRHVIERSRDATLCSSRYCTSGRERWEEIVNAFVIMWFAVWRQFTEGYTKLDRSYCMKQSFVFC